MTTFREKAFDPPMELTPAEEISRWRMYADRCRIEIVDLRASLERTTAELDALKRTVGK